MNARSQFPIAFVDLIAQREELGSAIDEAIGRVLSHGRFISGPEVAQLEAALAKRTGSANVVGCASGTDALLLPLVAWGVGPGDAVFVPAFTFVAPAEVASLLGATPVFCDVDPSTANIAPDVLRRAVGIVRERNELRPRVVIPVDLYGQPADHEEIAAVARTHGMKVIVDAAQSFGSTYAGRPTGGHGDVTATSFFPSKPLGCYGDGGAVITDDPEVADAMRSLREHGRGETKYAIDRVGLNSRLDTLQAAILLAKLECFDDELAARDRVAHRYRERLEGVVDVPEISEDRTSAWAQYTVRSSLRDHIADVLGHHGVPTAIHYPEALHRQAAYVESAFVPEECSVADELASIVLSLPMHPYLRPDVQDEICDIIRETILT